MEVNGRNVTKKLRYAICHPEQIISWEHEETLIKIAVKVEATHTAYFDIRYGLPRLIVLFKKEDKNFWADLCWTPDAAWENMIFSYKGNPTELPNCSLRGEAVTQTNYFLEDIDTYRRWKDLCIKDINKFINS